MAVSKKTKTIIKIACLAVAAVLSAAATYAWFAGYISIHTSDDSTGTFTKTGMRINLLFNRLDPQTFSNGSTITFSDGTTGTFDSNAEWGTRDNPYIISESRHMVNLYALQRSGYFQERYINENYENGQYIQNSDIKPYFLVCDTDASPKLVDGNRNGSNIVLQPIGNDEYPFIGCVGGAQVSGTATAPNGKTSISSIIANFTVDVDKDEPDVGLFGKIGYLGDETDTSTTGGVETFNGSVSGISNLLLYDIQIVSKPDQSAARPQDHLWSADISNNVRFTEDHHVGILAGHIEYAAIENISVYYSSDSIKAIDVDQQNANYLTDSGIIGLVYNLNPSIEGNSIGSKSGTTVAGRVEGAGEEWGGSIDMLKLHTRLQSTLAQAKQSGNTYTYSNADTVIINEVTGETTTNSTSTANYQNLPGNDGTAIIRTYQSEWGGSFVFADENNANNTVRYNLFHGKSLTYFPRTVTTYTYKDQFENGFTVQNGSNYLHATSNNNNVSVSNTTDGNTAAIWQLDANGRLNARVELSNGIAVYYLIAQSDGTLTMTTTETGATVWTKNQDGTLTCTLDGYTRYLRYNNGWSTYPFTEYFTLSNGSDYLGVNNSTSTVNGTAATAANWHLENGIMAAFISNNVRYLNAMGETLTIGTTPAITNWEFDNEGRLSYLDGNSTRWYVCDDNGAWKLFPEKSYYLFSNGSDYLSCTAGGIVNAAQNGSVKWAWDKFMGRIYTVINNTVYYLNGAESLSVSTTPSTSWMYVNGRLCYENNGTTWYVYDNNGTWTVYPAQEVFTVSQNGNYLTVTGNAQVGSVTDASAALCWMFDDANGRLYTVYNGTVYYLNASGAVVSVSTTPSTVWSKDSDDNFTYNNGGENWTLTYNGTWGAYPPGDLATINCGLDYLSVSAGNVADSSSPYYWIVDQAGRYSTFVNGTRYYLSADNTGISLNTNPAQGTVFSADNTNHRLSFNYNNNTYYVVFNGASWTVSDSYVKGVYITTTSGGTTYYLNASASGVSTGTDATTATGWSYNGTSGTVSTVINGQTYYLRAAYETNNKVNSTNLSVTTNANNATTFNYTANNLRCTIGNTTHNLSLDNNTFKMVNTAATYYLIHNGNNYLSLNGTTIQNSDADNAVLWSFSNDRQGNNNTTVSSLYNGTARYLYVDRSGSFWSYTYTLDFGTNDQNWYYTNNNYLRNRSYTSYYARYANNEWTAGNSQALTRTSKRFTAATVNLATAYYTTDSVTSAQGVTTDLSSLTPGTTATEYTAPFILTKTDTAENVEHTFTDKQRQIVTKTVDQQAGGNDTYFPLDADTTAPFNVTDKNTGYIIGGTHATYQQIWGDVRVAYYNMSSLSAALNGATTYNGYASRLEVLTRTYKSDGFKRVSDTYNSTNDSVNTAVSGYTKMTTDALGLKKYDASREQLHDVFNEQPTRVYGMHFMDAAISMENLIVAPKVKINGTEYTNYQMPEDSIDFRLKTKGYINFFAGTYYVNSTTLRNNSFFSLNQIFRNSKNEITDIKRIEKIYGDPTSEKKSYIYKYDGEAAPALPSGYVEMFDTDWIERPTLVDNAMYYFEVPVNAGEYALGSVDEAGRYGAYLCYLDIGTSAADHTSVLGTIDFVYDNLNDKIVTVTDTSESDTSLNYYVPSLTILYSKNTDETNTVSIDNFTVNVRRTIASVNDSAATLTATFSGSDAEHLALIKQTNNLGDTIVQNTN